LALGFWQGSPSRLFAPHRGVSLRLSGSLVFRFIGLILVFWGTPGHAGVSDGAHDCLPPGTDVHRLKSVLRRCGCAETLRMGSFGTFGSFGTALTLVDRGTSGSYARLIILGYRTLCRTACKRRILLKNSVRSGLKCIVPQDVEAMVATNYQS
jgi:hypothetical protein